MKNKRVLIVDDNDLNRKLFENLLGQIYQIESANNGLEGLEKLENTKFDLVLMDIQMPVLDGITAMKRIRYGQHSDTLIVAITAFADESDRDSFLEMGFDEFILKPIRPREFLETIKLTIDQRQGALSVEEPKEQCLEILNKTTLLQLLKYNSKEVMDSVMRDFIAECDLIARQIKEQKYWKHPEEFILSIHSLKGNAGTLGVEKIHQAAFEAESLARKNQINDLQVSLPNLEEAIIEFKKYYNEFIIEK